jgi:hypothetical protein
VPVARHPVVGIDAAEHDLVDEVEAASWNMLGTVASSGFTHIPLFILSFFAPAINVAAFTAVRAPMQPMQIVVRSLDPVPSMFQLAEPARTEASMSARPRARSAPGARRIAPWPSWR